MKRLIRIGMAMLLVAGCLRADGDSARQFIDRMLRGIGADPVSCPVDVVEGTRSRKMQAVCARFDGDFHDFAQRWSSGLEQGAAGGTDDASASGSEPRPFTSWEGSGRIHERVYAVGSAWVGVRFHRGEIVLVYK